MFLLQFLNVGLMFTWVCHWREKLWQRATASALPSDLFAFMGQRSVDMFPEGNAFQKHNNLKSEEVVQTAESSLLSYE